MADDDIESKQRKNTASHREGGGGGDDGTKKEQTGATTKGGRKPKEKDESTPPPKKEKEPEDTPAPKKEKEPDPVPEPDPIPRGGTVPDATPEEIEEVQKLIEEEPEVLDEVRNDIDKGGDGTGTSEAPSPTAPEPTETPQPKKTQVQRDEVPNTWGTKEPSGPSSMPSSAPPPSAPKPAEKPPEKPAVISSYGPPPEETTPAPQPAQPETPAPAAQEAPAPAPQHDPEAGPQEQEQPATEPPPQGQEDDCETKKRAAEIIRKLQEAGDTLTMELFQQIIAAPQLAETEASAPEGQETGTFFETDLQNLLKSMGFANQSTQLFENGKSITSGKTNGALTPEERAMGDWFNKWVLRTRRGSGYNKASGKNEPSYSKEAFDELKNKINEYKAAKQQPAQEEVPNDDGINDVLTQRGGY